MFFTEKDNQIYLASVVDSKRKRASACMKNISFSPQTCLRLMAETVLLLKELQTAGVLINEPLEKFIQLEQSAETKDSMSISMLNFLTKAHFPQSKNVFSQPTKKFNS